MRTQWFAESPQKQGLRRTDRVRRSNRILVYSFRLQHLENCGSDLAPTIVQKFLLVELAGKNFLHQLMPYVSVVMGCPSTKFN
jgi:hypothetical protein